MRSKILQIILIIIFVIDLFLIFSNQTELRFFTKPILLPVLILMYISKLKSEKIQLAPFFLAGLVLSFFGDLFLLFKWGFLPGLGSFLLAHLFYIISFKKKVQHRISAFWPVILSLYASILLFFFSLFKRNENSSNYLCCCNCYDDVQCSKNAQQKFDYWCAFISNFRYAAFRISILAIFDDSQFVGDDNLHFGAMVFSKRNALI